MIVELIQPIDADGEIIPAGKVIEIFASETAHEVVRRGIGRPVSGIPSNHGTGQKQFDTKETFVLIASHPPSARKPSGRKGRKVNQESRRSTIKTTEPTEQARWHPEIQALIDRFMTWDPPKERFWLEDGPYFRSIESPARFYESLRRYIEVGPRGTEMMQDKLISDLVVLWAKFNRKSKAF